MRILAASALALAALALVDMASSATGKDYYLTIGGGYAPSGNQASIEKNVLFFERVLAEHAVAPERQAVFFSDGLDADADLQVLDVQSVPQANRLMAEFFGDEDDLGMFYRNHAVPNVRGSTSPANIRKWFHEVGSTLQAGDRLVLYVTAHGEASRERGNPYETAILLWDDQRLRVRELVDLLDELPEGVSVAAIMVQCYTGGFARFIYNDADPEQGLSTQRRCGFFATVHDRVAAGCTPDVDTTSYVEYSSYFWEALGGRTQAGDAGARPDYDGDGRTSFAEAHAYTVLHAETIDLPVKTSSEFLSVESQFADREHPELLADDAPYDEVLKLATPAERAILEGLSAELELAGNERIDQAERARPERRGRRFRGRSAGRGLRRLRGNIADDLEERWPELANVLNPGAIELVTTRSAEFVAAVEQHPSYRDYRAQAEAAAGAPDPQKRRVKFERFVATAEDVILRENLRRLGDAQRIAQYEAIVAAENEGLVAADPAAPAVRRRGSSGRSVGRHCWLVQRTPVDVRTAGRLSSGRGRQCAIVAADERTLLRLAVFLALLALRGAAPFLAALVVFPAAFFAGFLADADFFLAVFFLAGAFLPGVARWPSSSRRRWCS